MSDAGLRYVVRAPDVAVAPLAGEAPLDTVRRLAKQKAFAVSRAPGEIVLAADTEVVIGREVLGKPAGAAGAERMLRLLAGREHEVITGICLRGESGAIVDSASTRVHFVDLSDEELAAYVSSGEPMDKAGAYAIQGLASKFIDRIEGCYFNVVGLPMALVYRHLKSMGYCQ